MQNILHEEKSQIRSYRHFTLPPVETGTVNKGIEFFYIGKKTKGIDRLIASFSSGYAADSIEEARTMLRSHASFAAKGPDVIVAEAGLGYSALLLLSQFLATQKKLNTVPFLIEGSSIGDTEIERFRKEPFADDIVSLEEISSEKLVAKIRFWKKIKTNLTSAQPAPENFHPSAGILSEVSKRALDVFLSLSLMILLSPLFLLIALALKIESKGPVFYISNRAGRGYRIFRFYKFRTMVAEANNQIQDFTHRNIYSPLKENGPMFIKIDNDPRITRLGAFLRKCSLDELPQLLNVLKGDMSLVGNRPLPLYEAATLTTDEWASRFMAPAGITGLWQIKRKDKWTMTAEERVGLDIRYATNSNLLFDLWIIVNTPSAVIQRTNA